MIIMALALLLFLAVSTLGAHSTASRTWVSAQAEAARVVGISDEGLGPPATAAYPRSAAPDKVAPGGIWSHNTVRPKEGTWSLTAVPWAVLTREAAFRIVPSVAAAPQLVSFEQTASRISSNEITKRLDRYLAGRAGPVTAMVEDLTTGRRYRYHPDGRMITASTAKAQILMALLLDTPWSKLSANVKRDAELMIRFSDNHAADRLWLRIGGAPGFTAAGRKLGLRHTQGVSGNCVDLYCWGITRTSAQDQIRLMRALVSPGGPLSAKDRKRVLGLMGRIVDGQNWGVSAARCPGERVALKNGWLKRVSNKRWAVVSVGLVRGDGRDYAIAVLTEGSAEVATGIATVEGIAERIMRSFRKCPA